MARSGDSDSAMVRRMATARESLPSLPIGAEQAQQVAELVLMVVPAAFSIGQQAWDLLARERAAARERKAARAEEEQAEAQEPVTVPELERSTMERLGAYFGEMLYDYSGGAYGLKPPSLGTLRRSRKLAERAAREARAVADGAAAAPQRGRALVPLILVGAVGAAGLVTVAIWQRVQLRAAAHQAIDAGRQAVRQIRERSVMPNASSDASHVPNDHSMRPGASPVPPPAPAESHNPLPHSAAMSRTQLPPQV